MLKTDRLPAREEMQEHSKKAWEGYNLICEKMEREHWGEYITITLFSRQ